jgi:hypothetical protein
MSNWQQHRSSPPHPRRAEGSRPAVRPARASRWRLWLLIVGLVIVFSLFL